jgi:pimeloyl-ACP methyl ester carboxylesterase
VRTEGSGPPVVKVAGLAGGVELYAEEIALARAAGFRVAALDTSGDRRDDPAPARLSWELLAGEVVQAIDRLGVERAVIWGTSFGCLICLAAAARRPERVSGLLLNCPPRPAWRSPLYLSMLGWASRRREPDLWTAGLFQAGFLALNAWEFANVAALARLGHLSRSSAEAGTPMRTIREKLELLFGEHPGSPPAGAPPIPATIIHGAGDMITLPGAARAVAALLPGCRERRLLWGGHACAYSRPGTHGRWVVEELERLTGET